MDLRQAGILSRAKARCDFFVGLYDEPVDISRMRIVVSALPFRGRWKDMIGLALLPNLIIIAPGNEYNETLIIHELVHCWQMQQLGVLKQWIEYEIEQRRHGYWDNFFEIEARFVAGQEL